MHCSTECAYYAEAIPETKEEWEDCTKEYLQYADTAYISTHNTDDGYYSFCDGIYRILTKRHPFGHDVFKIERRVTKKVCKECGREI